jgi:hypothetical protein
MNDKEPEAEISETILEEDDAKTSLEDKASNNKLYPEEGIRGRYIIIEVYRLYIELITNY